MEQPGASSKDIPAPTTQWLSLFEEKCQKLLRQPLLEVKDGNNICSLSTSSSSASLSPSIDEKTESCVCSSCSVTLDSPQEYREHCKTPWHVYNVKQISLKRASLTEADWEELQEEEDETAEVEDVGEAEADVTQSLHSSRLVFRTAGQCFTIWKNVLWAGNSPDFTLAQCQVDIHRLTTTPRWAVLLISGGRFAGAVFTQKDPIEHKAFQRYTVRRKQGGTQATKDNQSGTNQPKSIGSSLRRKEAQRFIELTEQTLNQWKVPLKACDLIFIFAPSTNLGTLFFEGSPLSKDDPRIRRIPFPLRRPTFAECLRVHKWLSTVEIEPRPEDQPLQVAAVTVHVKEPKKKKKKKRAIVATSKEQKLGGIQENEQENEEEEEEEEDEGEELVRAALVANDIAALEKCYEGGQGGDTTAPLVLALQLGRLNLLPVLLKHEKVNEVELESLQTALHVACAGGNTETISLLLEQGADPTARDSRGQTPYHVCKTKSSRLALRRFAGEHPDKWVYDFPTLDAAEEEQQKQAKKDAKARKKTREKEAKEKKREEKEADAAKEADKLRAQKQAADLAKAVVAREALIQTMTPRERALEGVFYGLVGSVCIFLAFVAFKRYRQHSAV